MRSIIIYIYPTKHAKGKCQSAVTDCHDVKCKGSGAEEKALSKIYISNSAPKSLKSHAMQALLKLMR
jgi:hypothetical protein